MSTGAVEPVPIGAGRGFGYWGRFYLLLAIAAIIASIGLYSDSGAVVIAAMLIAPLMEPILGIASSLVQGHLDRVVRLSVATLFAAVVVIFIGALTIGGFQAPRGIELAAEVLARTDPSLGDLVVALVAGVAGAYVQMRQKEAGLLPGVAIGVSLVPPLAAAGILLLFGEPALAWGATLLFLTNLAAIVFSASAVFLVLGMRPATHLRRGNARAVAGAGASILVVVLISLHLGVRTAESLQEARDEQIVSETVEAWAGVHPVEILKIDVEGDLVELDLLLDVPLARANDRVAPGELVSGELEFEDLPGRIEAALQRELDVRIGGRIRYVGVWEKGPGDGE